MVAELRRATPGIELIPEPTPPPDYVPEPDVPEPEVAPEPATLPEPEELPEEPDIAVAGGPLPIRASAR